MKANLINLEPEILSKWQTLNIYRRLRKERKNREKFVLHDGPPYANGLIHIGHAINKILKDIILKYKVMKGYDCPFIIGWDCHGLPVEHQLFKELKSTKHEIETTEFRKKAKDFALKFVELQKDDFKRLGVFSDWDNPYLTLDPNYEYAVVKLLENLVTQGYIYRGRKPVNWCATCETALAEAEVEYLDKESDSLFFLFAVKDGKGLLSEDVHFLVWTTTAWTLISNVAVALHPDFEYALVKYNDKPIVLVKDLIPRLEKKFNTKFEVLKLFRGKDLESLILQHPFLDRNSPVVLADFVSLEEGSGCVHIAPGHGEEDFSLTKRYELPIIMPVNDQGVFDEPAEFKGKNIQKAGEKVLARLKEENLLLHHEKIVHSYPHCWRCKNPIIFRATFQWFLKIDHKNLRERLIQQIENVRWVPSSGKERMKAMLLTRPDWCLSRQRLWGVPIPAVKCKACNEVILDRRIIAKVAKIFKEKGSDCWFELDLKTFLPAGFKCFRCAKREFIKECDILDVWFESGASFAAVVKADKDLRYPADMYLEGSDQHRGWFQVSLIPSTATEGRSPYQIILTHGFVVDGEGRKMSKSLGNVIAPQEIIKEYGAEILRLWSACSDYSEDVKISRDIIKQLVEIYRKVRNTIRFILGNIFDYHPQKDSLKYEELLEVDRLMLSRTMIMFKEVISFYEEFSFYKAAFVIFNFCNLDLSSFYLDILKDRLYTFSPKSKERRSAQFVLSHILKILLKTIAPILSFTAEEAYRAWDIPQKSDSIFILKLDEEFIPDWVDEDLNQRWQKILSLRDKVLKEIELLREKGKIGSSLEAKVILSLEESDYKFYQGYQDILREILIVSKVTINEGSFQIKIEKADGKKCLRCWNWREDVGKAPEFPEVCGRCITVLTERR